MILGLVSEYQVQDDDGKKYKLNNYKEKWLMFWLKKQVFYTIKALVILTRYQQLTLIAIYRVIDLLCVAKLQCQAKINLNLERKSRPFLEINGRKRKL